MKPARKLSYSERLYWYEQEKKQVIYTARTQSELNEKMLKLVKKWGI